MPIISATNLDQMSSDLPDGSMRPKAAVLSRFARESNGGEAWVGPLEGGYEALTEGRGTTVVHW